MLNRTSENVSTGGASAKQIALQAQASMVVYTVPMGKTFVGILGSNTPPGGTGVLPMCQINGANFYLCPTNPVVTLVGGTVVTSVGNYINILGVEQ